MARIIVACALLVESYCDPHGLASTVGFFLWLQDIEEWQETNGNNKTALLENSGHPQILQSNPSIKCYWAQISNMTDFPSGKRRGLVSDFSPSNSNDWRVTFSESASGTKAFFCHILGHLQRKYSAKKWEAAEVGVLTLVFRPHRSILHLAGSPVDSRPNAAF